MSWRNGGVIGGGIEPISQPRDAGDPRGAIKTSYEQISVSSSSSTIELTGLGTGIEFYGQTRLTIELKFCTRVLLGGLQWNS